MHKLLIILAVALATLGVVFAQSSSAAQFTIPFAAVDHLPVGSVHTVGTYAVPAGETCTITTTNNDSLHTAASMTFESGGQSLTLHDTEAAPGTQRSGIVFTETGSLTVTATIGQDEQYAPGDGGFSITEAAVDCVTPPTTTPPATTVPTTTTPTAPPRVPVPPPARAIPLSPPGPVVVGVPNTTG